MKSESFFAMKESSVKYFEQIPFAFLFSVKISYSTRKMVTKKEPKMFFTSPPLIFITSTIILVLAYLNVFVPFSRFMASLERASSFLIYNVKSFCQSY